MSDSTFIDALKAYIPDYAKDIRLNIDTTLVRSSLTPEHALACALCVAFTTQNKTFAQLITQKSNLSESLQTAAYTASSLMAMNNIYYPFVEMSGDATLKQTPPQLRMNAYATHGGVEKKVFEMLTLSASIIGKCEFCIQSHYELLQKEGISAQELKDIGRLCAVMNAVSKIIAMHDTNFNN